MRRTLRVVLEFLISRGIIRRMRIGLRGRYLLIEGEHQLNQHYLDDMFPLEKTLQRARAATEGDFMHRKVRVRTDGTMKVTTKAELPPSFVVTGDEGRRMGV